MPQETGSARFLQAAIYLGDTVRFEGIREEEIQWMQSLQAGLWDQPFEKAPVRVQARLHLIRPR